MRPINKGNSPYNTIKSYPEALPYLEERIGLYCSYCELPIFHVPEVEHVVSKSRGGNRTEWDNLLLGCKYCNTRKGNAVGPENKETFLWPDENNTALVYSYEDGIPKVNEKKILGIDPSGKTLNRAKNLFDLVKLDNVPVGSDKDHRFRKRNEAYVTARESLKNWIQIKGTTAEEALEKQILISAKAVGFFSIWMEVFQKEPDIKKALIKEFPGTENRFFTDDGKVREIISLREAKGSTY